MSNDENFTDHELEIREQLRKVPKGKLVKLNLYETSWVYSRFKPRNPPYSLCPDLPMGIVGSKDEIDRLGTPPTHPLKDSIKVERDDYFLRLSPPYQIAGYIAPHGEKIENGVVISIHSTWRNSAIPCVSIKAIKSLEVLD